MASDLDPPTFASPAAGIAGVSHHTQPGLSIKRKILGKESFTCTMDIVKSDTIFLEDN
jgi:hypothetical protein